MTIKLVATHVDVFRCDTRKPSSSTVVNTALYLVALMVTFLNVFYHMMKKTNVVFLFTHRSMRFGILIYSMYLLVVYHTNLELWSNSCTEESYKLIKLNKIKRTFFYIHCIWLEIYSSEYTDQGHLANVERVFTKIIVYTKVLNH